MTTKVDSLGQFEQFVLTAIMALREQAYGLQIYSKVCELAGKQVNLGSIYVTLDRLENKGYIASAIADGTPERGGRPKRFCRLQPAGMLALEESVKAATRVSDTFYKSWGIGKWRPKRAK